MCSVSRKLQKYLSLKNSDFRFEYNYKNCYKNFEAVLSKRKSSFLTLRLHSSFMDMALPNKCESPIDALTKPCFLPCLDSGPIMLTESNIVLVMGSTKSPTLSSIYILDKSARSMYSLSRVLLPSKNSPALTWKPKE